MNPQVFTYGLLGLAVVCEVIGTSLLPRTEGFTRLVPTLVMALCYGLAFYLLSLATRTIPVSIVYALWSGLGIVLVAGFSYFIFRETLDLPAVAGIGLILAGVVLINGFSNSVSH